MPAERLDVGAKVPGTDGQKMSKSYGNTIDIFAEGKPLKKTVMGIVTDSTPPEAPKDPETRTPFRSTSCSRRPRKSADLAARYRAGGMGYGTAKQMLLEKIDALLRPVPREAQATGGRPELRRGRAARWREAGTRRGDEDDGVGAAGDGASIVPIQNPHAPLRPDRAAQVRRPDAHRPAHRRGLPHRRPPQPVQGLFRRVRRASPVHARRRDSPHRLAGRRQDRSLLRQGIRGGNQPQGVSRSSMPPAAWGFAGRRSH